MEKIKNAIKALGERSDNITTISFDDSAVVYVNSEYFGIYDFAKNTFVD